MGLFGNREKERNPQEIKDTARAGAQRTSPRLSPSAAFPRVLEFVDMHQKDGYPDSPYGALGSRYQLVQMLSLRDPMDARYINDSHQVPYWLRTTANLPGSTGGTGEIQRMGLSPAPPLSPYQVEDWRQQLYDRIPLIGNGPGTAWVVPTAQTPD